MPDDSWLLLIALAAGGSCWVTAVWLFLAVGGSGSDVAAAAVAVAAAVPRLVVASLADAGDGRGELPLVLEPDDSDPGVQQTNYMYMINTYMYIFGPREYTKKQ